MCLIEDLVESANTFYSKDNLDYISAIVIKKSSDDQLHCGILYRDKGGLKLIHLAWHYSLVVDGSTDYINKYLWIKPKLHPFKQELIAAMCNRIPKRNGSKIPYGLRFNTSSFSRDGLLFLGESESGFTCATFVLAIFISCGCCLIDIERWDERPEDEVFHQKIIETMEKYKEEHKIDEKHIAAVRSEKGCARYRPEEVSISSSFKNIPADSTLIREKGSELYNYLDMRSTG
jgi:hypothetical protein